VRSGALQVTDDLIEADARATVLVGSHARGDAGPESDLDISSPSAPSLFRGGSNVVTACWSLPA
jgi:predicted nucleotidyltransferase